MFSISRQAETVFKKFHNARAQFKSVIYHVILLIYCHFIGRKYTCDILRAAYWFKLKLKLELVYKKYFGKKDKGKQAILVLVLLFLFVFIYHEYICSLYKPRRVGE